MNAITLKLNTLYAAYSPELGVLSYGACRDEALNNLTDEIHDRLGERVTGDEKKRHV